MNRRFFIRLGRYRRKTISEGSFPHNPDFCLLYPTVCTVILWVTVLSSAFIFPFIICGINSDCGLKAVPRIPKVSSGEAADSELNITMYYFYSPLCDFCIEKNITVHRFLESLGDDAPTYIAVEIYVGNSTADNFARSFFNSDIIPFPSVVFVANGCKYLLKGEDITETNLGLLYSEVRLGTSECTGGWVQFRPFNPFIGFISGLISGLSPCLVLIGAVIGSAAMGSDDRKKLRIIMAGFIIGTVFAYFVVGIMFYTFLGIISSGSRLIVGLTAVPLIILGIWYIIDAKKTDSKLFGTPDKLKKFFGKMALESSPVSAFILGVLFTILKSPCVAGALFGMVYMIVGGSLGFGVFMTALMFFILGLLIPIIAVFILLDRGFSSEKMEEFRKKSRPYIRAATGVLIIITTLFSLIPILFG